MVHRWLLSVVYIAAYLAGSVPRLVNAQSLENDYNSAPIAVTLNFNSLTKKGDLALLAGGGTFVSDAYYSSTQTVGNIFSTWSLGIRYVMQNPGDPGKETLNSVVQVTAYKTGSDWVGYRAVYWGAASGKTTFGSQQSVVPKYVGNLKVVVDGGGQFLTVSIDADIHAVKERKLYYSPLGVYTGTGSYYALTDAYTKGGVFDDEFLGFSSGTQFGYVMLGTQIGTPAITTPTTAPADDGEGDATKSMDIVKAFSLGVKLNYSSVYKDREDQKRIYGWRELKKKYDDASSQNFSDSIIRGYGSLEIPDLKIDLYDFKFELDSDAVLARTLDRFEPFRASTTLNTFANIFRTILAALLWWRAMAAIVRLVLWSFNAVSTTEPEGTL